MKQKFYEETEVMEFLGYCKKSMQTYRSVAPRTGPQSLDGTNRIPPSVKIGTRWVYPKTQFSQWAMEKGFIHLVA